MVRFTMLFGDGGGMTVLRAIPRSSALASSTSLFEVTALTKRYRDELALGDVSFDVHAGEVLGLIGPNGAGKTTLLEAIAGVLPADAGSIRWRGVPLPSARRRDFMFYLPDGLRPWDDQYTGRVIDFFAAAHRRRATESASSAPSACGPCWESESPLCQKDMFGA
jgi:ABC-type multidrug transport system ATPase subunit